jgi:hypothetical protein
MHIGPFLFSGTVLAHPYLQFRLHLARHGLAQFIESVRSLALMAVILFSQMLLATVALIAFPPMYFASTGAWSLLLAYGLALALPCWLLRQRLLPADVVLWLRSRPVTAAMRWHADLRVAGLILAPLAIASTLSAGLILFYSAPWLRIAPALAGTIAALLLGWAVSALALGLRQRGVRSVLRAGPRAVRPLGTLAPAHIGRRWLLLYWHPFWRLENSVGIQQCLFFAAALVAAASWMWFGWVPAIAANIATSALLVVVTDRGDRAVREQAARIAPAVAAWPVRGLLLTAAARAFSAAPALCVLAMLLAGGIHGARAGAVYIALGVIAILLIVAPPNLSVRARPGIVLVSMVALMAAGSELP